MRSIKFRVVVTPLIVFTLEDLYGLTVSESDEDICLKVDTSKDKDAHELWKMLYAWKEQADKLSSEENSKDKYDEGRYHYPEFDTTQTWAKVPLSVFLFLFPFTLLKCSTGAVSVRENCWH